MSDVQRSKQLFHKNYCITEVIHQVNMQLLSCCSKTALISELPD